MRRNHWFLGLLSASIACGSFAACGGSDSATPPVGDDGGETGSTVAPGDDASVTVDATADATDNDVLIDIDSSTTDAGADTATDDAADGASDAATDDGAPDGASDAGDAGDASDAAVACVGTDTPCQTSGGKAGLCKGGVCSACVDPTDDLACTAAYATDGGDSGAASYLCAAGACVPGNCHDSSACKNGKLCTANTCSTCTTDKSCIDDPSYGAGTICGNSGGCVSNACVTPNTACGQASGHFCCPVSASNVCVSGDCCDNAQCSGGKPACVANTCTSCDAVANNVYVVDPVNGSDTSTGSGKAGGVANGVCAVKTIKKAIALINAAGAAPAGTKIVVLGPSTPSAVTGETFPIALPANVALESSGGTVTVLASGAPAAVVTMANATTIRGITVDGAKVTGTCVNVLGTASGTLDGDVIRQCATGVRAGDTSTATITGTSIRENTGVGLALTGSAAVTLTGTNVPIEIRSNGVAGISVTERAVLTANGDAASENIKVSQNVGAGVFFQQDPTAGALTVSSLTGVVVRQQATAAGFDLRGGSSVQLRACVSLANLYGVNLASNTLGNNYVNDMSKIDLGTDLTTNAGGNTFQDKSVASGGTPNTGSGICVAIQPNKSQVIAAFGNKFATAAGTGTIDCKTATVGTVIGSTATCTGGANIGGTSAVNGNTLNIQNCSP